MGQVYLFAGQPGQSTGSFDCAPGYARSLRSG